MNPSENYCRRCRLNRVIDGDTVDLDVDLAFDLSMRIRVRLEGVDTPEIRGEERPEGLVAKHFVEDWFAAGEIAAIDLEDPDFVLQSLEWNRGKYGRCIGRIYDATGLNDAASQCLNDALIEKGWGSKP